MPRLLDWAIDYTHLARGGVLMFAHRNPPKHYLGYVVAGKAPVLILPGIMGRWGFYKPLADHLSLQGHPTYIIPKLGLNLSDVPSSAKMVREVVDEQDIQGAVLVGHSKGGIIGKYLLEFDNADERIKGMVSIATPYSGSSITKLFPHPSFRELLADSEIIRKLGQHKEINKRIVSIAPEFDNHVWSEKGSFLEGAMENIKLSIKGHHKIIYDKAVWAKIDQAIGKISS